MSMLPLPRRISCALVGTAAVLGGLVSTGTAAAAPGRAAIPGTHPRWAVSRPGAAAQAVTTGNVNLRVYLAGPDPSGLAAYAAAVSDPSNANYGNYLTPAQAQARFAATNTQVDAVKSWLTSQGLTVTGVTSGFGGYVSVTGTLAQAGQAFGVSFANYTDPSGHTARAPQSAATVPSSIAGDVLAVSGLDTGNHQMKPQDQLPPPGPNYWVAPPVSRFYGQLTAFNEPPFDGTHWSWNVAGYTPQQVRGAYGITDTGMTGAGQTVAIVDAYASPTMPSDANQFSRATRNQPFRPGQYQQYTPASYSYTSDTECGASGWYGEETLDIEQVHGTAPNANVRFVAGASCLDTDLAAADALVVNNHLASIVTDSFGEPYDGATIQPVWDDIFEAGAVEGIGFMFSSGDSGYEDPAVEDPYSDQIQVDYPTSSPWVTSVGGTSLAVGPRNDYQWELPWGTLINPLSGNSWSLSSQPTYGDPSTNPNAWPYDGSGGGGVSTAYPQPWYQRWVVPYRLATDVPEGSTTTPMRVIPDVSALADPSTGVLVGQTTLQPDGKTYAFALSRIGGTSVASPVFAGVEADAQQAAGYDLGFANPAIYARYGTSAFHDVTQGPEPQFQVRNNYTNPYTATGPLVTFLRAMGVNGGPSSDGNASLVATRGYDDATGVGSPNQYVQSFFGRRDHRRR
jgi:subtilase family serine protease